MSLTETQKTNVCRHLGYEVTGIYYQAIAGQQLAYGGSGYRYFGVAGALIYRLNQMKSDEEARLTGSQYADVGWGTGLGPNPGDTASITVSGAGLGSPVTVTVTVPQANPPWLYMTVAANLAEQLAGNSAFVAAGLSVQAPYGGGPLSQQRVALPIVAIRAPSGAGTMTVSCTGTGQSIPQLTQSAGPISPYLSFRQVGVTNVIYGYLPILDYLENAYLGGTINQGLSAADDVIYRHDELEIRMKQYLDYTQQMAQWIGIPRNPDSVLKRFGGDCQVGY
jgi:hypothetical protein